VNILKLKVNSIQLFYDFNEDFKPVYKSSIRRSNILKKKFNYKQKNFNTVIRRSDPVKRMQ